MKCCPFKQSVFQVEISIKPDPQRLRMIFRNVGVFVRLTATAFKVGRHISLSTLDAAKNPSRSYSLTRISFKVCVFCFVFSCVDEIFVMPVVILLFAIKRS